MAAVRRSMVAGRLYPAERTALVKTLQRLLASPVGSAAVPKALVVPHSNFAYSGATAAAGFAQLAPARQTIRRVALIGPSHDIPFHGLALSSVRAFETPLGQVEVDTEVQDRISELPQVLRREDVHRDEHSLEVQLPFLQWLLPEARIVPLLVGETEAAEVLEVLECLDDPQALIVISSDLSHFHSSTAARVLDRATAALIETLQPVGHQGACCRGAINGLLAYARRHELRVSTLAIRNSGDACGDDSRVVGYGSFGFYSRH